MEERANKKRRFELPYAKTQQDGGHSLSGYGTSPLVYLGIPWMRSMLAKMILYRALVWHQDVFDSWDGTYGFLGNKDIRILAVRTPSGVTKPDGS